MSFVNGIVSELRDKRLLALGVAVLAAAIVAVPVLLSKGSKATPVAQAPATGPVGPPTGVPVVSTSSTPAGGKLSGPARNPFTQLVHAASSVASSIAAPGTSGTVGTTGTTGTSTTPTAGSTTSTTGTSTSGASTSTPAPTIPTGTPKPAPTGLTATQSYEVKLAITNSSGGLDTIDPLERLTVLPSVKQPLLVELGVLKGGSRVLFAVQPGARVSGPGSCIPGPIDCEILSLGQDAVEALSLQTASGVQAVALFAVTGITAANHGSVAAANQARRAASAAGRDLLDASPSSAPSLFRYEPSVGAVVDLRNLTVGG